MGKAGRLVRITTFILVLFTSLDSTGNQPMNVAIVLAFPNIVDDVIYIARECLGWARKRSLRL